MEPVPEGEVPRETVRRYFRFTEKWVILTLGWIIFLPSVVFGVYLLLHPPTPADVCWINTRYTAGGRVVRRDVFPLSARDIYLLTIFDPAVRKTRPLEPEYFDQMDFSLLLHYRKMLGFGPALSDNFYEKFEKLQINYQIHLGFAGIGVFVSLVLLLLGYLLNRKPKPSV